MGVSRILGLVGFVLAVAGGILLLRSGLEFRLTPTAVLLALLPITLGFLSVVGAFYSYARKYLQGGLVCVVAGLLGVFLVRAVPDGTLVLLGGIIALAAARR